MVAGISSSPENLSWRFLPNSSKWLAVYWCVVVIVVFTWVPAIPQTLSYHQFADQRFGLGLPHAWNVISNLPLLIVGCAGLWITARRMLSHNQSQSMMVFFSAVALTGLGSSWYHFNPDNFSLFYDRFPMALAFAALYISWLGRWQYAGLLRLLFPVLIIAVATVCWWIYTETQGAGDLRAYGLLQFGALLSAPLIVEASDKTVAARWSVYPVLLIYVVAKLCETFDEQIFQWGNFVAGHALKHIFVAFAAAWVLFDVYLSKHAVVIIKKHSRAKKVASYKFK
jgi:hypothetical protein